MTPTIRRAEKADLPTITSLAHAIWRPTYSPILSAEQIDFMLEKLYTPQGLDEAVRQGRVFYLLEEAEEPIGFLAVREVTEKRILRIESLYLLPSTQGKGYGSKLIDFAADLAVSSSQRILELNVNRQNKAHLFYRKQGFQVTQEVDIPYFGFVLDDYVMQKAL